MRKASARWLAALVALGVAGGALAQQGSPQGGMMGPGMTMGMDPDEGGAMPMLDMGRHVEGRLAFLKTELKITPAQEPLWDALAQTLRANGQKMAELMPMGGTMGRGEVPGLPERLDRQERFLAARLDALRAMQAAVTPLYAAFSEEQKRTADELVGGPMGMGTAM